MAITHIPSLESGKWSGMFRGWFSGNLWKTHNIDLEREEGKILLSKRLKTFANSGTLSNLGLIDAFVFSDADATSRFWGISRAGRLFKTASSSATGTWAQDALTGTLTDALDAAIHELNAGETRLIVTRDTDIAILNLANNNNTWVTNWWKKQALVSSTDATPIVVTMTAHGFKTGDTIKISGHTVNVAANGTWVITKVDANSFSLDSSVGSGAGAGGADGTGGFLNQTGLTTGVPHPIDIFNRTAIIGDDRYIHTIDRNDVVGNQKLTLQANLRILHIFHTKNRVWILTYDKFSASGKGMVIEWDGTSDTYLHAHPVYGIAAMAGCSYYNMPVVINEKGWILFFDGSNFVPKAKLFNDEDQLDLRFAGTDSSIKPRGMLVKDDVILISVASDDTSARPYRRMNAGVWCYNPKTGNLYHRYSFTQWNGTTAYDYGQAYVKNVGALCDVAGRDGFFSSALVYEAYTGTTKNHIYLTDDFADSGRGYLITPKIGTGEAEQTWKMLWLKFKKFTDSGNRIFLRARGEDPRESTTDLMPLTATITWVNTTSFTGAVPTGVIVGDEVEILAGDNAGGCAEITALSATPDGSATITVTVDAVPYASTRAALARFDNWVEKKVISDTAITKDQAPIRINSDYLQLKIELYGKFMQLNSLIIESEVNKNIES